MERLIGAALLVFVTPTLAQFGDLGDFRVRKPEDKVDVASTAPPEGAIVLFDGKNLDEWVSRNNPQRPAPWKLVDRLFLSEGVKIFRPHDLVHACRCSRARAATVLRALPRAELDELKTDGKLIVTCEFCNADHVFDYDDVVQTQAT